MLLPINRFIGAPLVSLQAEAVIAHTGEPIIDPRKLIVVGFYVGPQAKKQTPQVIHTSDIREVSHLGLIIDSAEDIMPLDDLVRLQEIINFGFELIGIPVVDEQGKKYGKVSDYSIDPKSFYVQQLFTQQSLLRSFGSLSKIIHRTQIISITNEKIVIKSAAIKEEVENSVRSAVVNPFRHAPQPGNQSSAVSARRISS